MSGQANLFPSMGDIASRTDALREVEDDDKRLAHDAPTLAEQEEGEEREVQEIESLCMRCHEQVGPPYTQLLAYADGQGTTRLLLTTIPYFKEIIVMSFRCDHCGHRDSEINSAGEIQRTSSFSVSHYALAYLAAKGVNYTCHLLTRKDLDRQLVKSNTATLTLPDFQLTIPPGRGQLTTVEGIVRDTIRDLDLEQPLRRHVDPETAAKIDAMLGNLRDMLGIDSNDDEIDKDDPNQKPFKPTSISIDDPSGNSFFQFHGTTSDPQWNMRAYNRTFEQNVTLGLVARPDDMPEQSASGQPMVDDDHKLSKPEDFEARRNIG